MFRKISQRVRKQDGFTLIELIVVVAILGILAAVLTPRVLDAIDNARANGAEAFGKELQLAMERYHLDNGAYPSVDQMEDVDATDDVLGYGDLVELLRQYASIDISQFDVNVGFTYEGRNAANVIVAEATVPVTYVMSVRLADANRTVTITPSSVTVSAN